MSKGWQGAVLRVLGATEHRLTVVDREHRAEYVVRAHLHSDTLLNPDGEAPAAWVRAWFPDPAGSRKELQRAYTLVSPDPTTGRFAVDFTIHEPAGPAPHWAASCSTGSALTVMRYGERPFAPAEPTPSGYLLLGDLSAYPAITSIVRALATADDHPPVVVHLESHSPYDSALPLPSGPGVTASWVAGRPDSTGLSAAVAGRDWSGWQAWVAAESAVTHQVRSVLRREHRLGRRHLHAQAYWVRGRAMGTDRSAQLEPPDGRSASLPA